MERHPTQSHIGRIVVRKKARRSTSETPLGKGTNVGVYYSCPKMWTKKWLETKKLGGAVWRTLRKEKDLEDPTPLLSQENVGCTQREAEIDRRAVQAKADLFRRIPH